ncbi:excisionase family DNA-binding protein [Planomonospora parontospora]|uniref:excisionase family DNA-binding protein n=1 Tax=Planomonospora parontospora TaxID=58119 RepID=UPI001EF3E726|nr:excisionase family DNA-binding protein [Planomonospora parontospora]
MLGIGRDKVFELLRSGQLRSYKEGRLRRIPAEAVEEYISRKLTEADAERVGGSERLRE